MDLLTLRPQDYHGEAFLSLATSYLSARARAWWSSPRPEARREPAQESEGKKGMKRVDGKAAGDERIFYTWLRVRLVDEAGSDGHTGDCPVYFWKCY
jgi:hypothetical protein